MLIPFTRSFETRITKRAAALDITPSAYVRQCVESEIKKANMATITSGTETPKLAGVAKDGPGLGWRWVLPGETITASDECRDRQSKAWVKPAYGGWLVINKNFYRRRIEKGDK